MWTTTKRPSRSVWKPTTRPQSPSSPSTRNAALFARCGSERKPGSLPGVASNCCHLGTALLTGPWFPSLVGQEAAVHCGWAWGPWLGLSGGSAPCFGGVHPAPSPSPVGLLPSWPISLQVNAEGSVDNVFSQVCTHLDALK